MIRPGQFRLFKNSGGGLQPYIVIERAGWFFGAKHWKIMYTDGSYAEHALDSLLRHDELVSDCPEDPQ